MRSVCFLTREAAVWQALCSLGETLPSAAASHCESGWVRRCTDPTRRLRLLETWKAAEQLRKAKTTTVSFPLRWVLFWGQHSRSVVIWLSVPHTSSEVLRSVYLTTSYSLVFLVFFFLCLCLFPFYKQEKFQNWWYKFITCILPHNECFTEINFTANTAKLLE